ncbi:MAG: hypothetical protein KIS66_01490 [Fimbriimonadaceae bacterium]|nr:hypothetical protein [Fimbriimonadaceae bacterium]
MNPQHYEEAVNVANVLGVRAICLFNDHRERLIRSRLRSAVTDSAAD